MTYSAIKIIEKTEKILLNRIQNKKNPVFISDFIITDQGLCGEFNESPKISSTGVLESEANLIARIVQQIKFHTATVQVFHIKKNFDNKHDYLKPDCVNNITRLSFNEFYFYPSREQGPLTENGFIDLINQIEKFAIQLPANLHLLISSVPVKNPLNEVRNLIVYVQSGKEPTVDIRAKANPSAMDPCYPGTVNSGFYSGSSPYYLMKIIRKILTKKDSLHNQDDLRHFMRSFLNNIDYPPPPELSALFAFQLELLKKKGARDELRLNTKNITGSLGTFLKDIKKKKKVFYSSFYTENTPGATLSEHSDIKAYYYGTCISGKTASNIEFPIYVGICLDHDLSTETAACKTDILYNRFTLFASQIVTSTSIDINQKNILTQYIPHADTYAFKNKYGVMDTKTGKGITPFFIFKGKNQYFGTKNVTLCTKSLQLETFDAEKSAMITSFNLLRCKLEAYRQAAAQYINERDAITLHIISEIALEVCDKFYAMYAIDPYKPCNIVLKKQIMLLLENNMIQIKNVFDPEMINGKDVWEIIEKMSRSIPHYTIYYNRMDILQSLLDIQIDPNSENTEKHTLLTVAIENNNSAAVDLLLKNSATNLNGENGNSETPLILCVLENNLNMAKKLLDDNRTQCNKRCDGQTALHYAIQLGFLPMVHLLIEAGSDPFLISSTQQQSIDYFNNYPELISLQTIIFTNYVNLFAATKNGNLTQIEHLLAQKNIYPNAINSDNKTIFEEAFDARDLQLVNYFLHNSCIQSDIIFSNGMTPLIQAIINDDDKMFLLLLDSKIIDRNGRDSKGNTALLHMAKYQQIHTLSFLKLLLNDKKIQINAQNSSGNTALHLAASNDFYNVTNCLLEFHADISIRNLQDETALDIARRKNYTDIIDLLSGHPQVNGYD